MSIPMDPVRQVLRYILWMTPGMALSLMIYLCLFPWRKRRLRARGLASGRARETGMLLLFLFSGGMVLLTLCPTPGWLYAGLCGHWSPYFDGWAMPLEHRVNFFPLSQGDSLFNLIGNVVMFVPFGFFFALLWQGWNWKRALGTGLGVTGFVECWQILVGRYFDIDDIILNTLGVLCGYGLWSLLRRLAPGRMERFHVRLCV